MLDASVDALAIAGYTDLAKGQRGRGGWGRRCGVKGEFGVCDLHGIVDGSLDGDEDVSESGD